MRTSLPIVVATIFVSGCGDGMLPETQLAGVIQQFQSSAVDFADARRAVAKERQAAINDTEEAAAASRNEAISIVGTWQLANDKERLRVYDRIVANAQGAGAAAEAMDGLVAGHAQSLSDADTHYKVRQEQLAAAVNALVALGTEAQLKDLLTFYLGYAQDTFTRVKALREEAKQAKDTKSP